MTVPFSVVVSATSVTSASSAVTTSGPIGMLPSKFLPAVHWVPARCHSRADASFSTTKPAIASSALSAGDVPAARADHDPEFALVVEPVGQRGLDQVRVRREHAVPAADERFGPGGDLPPALDGVLAVVHAKAEDAFRCGDGGPEVVRAVLAPVPPGQRPDRVECRRAGPQHRRERGELRVAALRRDVHVAGASPHVQPGTGWSDDGRKPHLAASSGVAAVGPSRDPARARIRLVEKADWLEIRSAWWSGQYPD